MSLYRPFPFAPPDAARGRVSGALCGAARDLATVAAFAVAFLASGCVLALSPADVERHRAAQASASWIYHSDAAPPADQLLARGIYCDTRRTLEDNAVDASDDAGIACEPEGGQ